MKKRETISGKIKQVQQEIAQMYSDYELAVQEGDQFRDTAMDAYDSLEHALEYGRTDDVLSVYHRRVQTYSALATMCYAKAQAIKP